MDSLCERLDALTSQLSRSLEATDRSPRAGSITSQNEDLMITAQLLNSLPNVQESVNEELQDSSGSEDSDTNDDECQDENAGEREDEHAGQAGALVSDSYGRPR